MVLIVNYQATLESPNGWGLPPSENFGSLSRRIGSWVHEFWGIRSHKILHRIQRHQSSKWLKYSILQQPAHLAQLVLDFKPTIAHLGRKILLRHVNVLLSGALTLQIFTYTLIMYKYVMMGTYLYTYVCVYACQYRSSNQVLLNILSKYFH